MIKTNFFLNKLIIRYVIGSSSNPYNLHLFLIEFNNIMGITLKSEHFMKGQWILLSRLWYSFRIGSCSLVIAWFYDSLNPILRF